MAGPGIGVLMFVAHREMEQRIVGVIRAAGYTDATLAQGRSSPGSGRAAPGSATWPRWPR